MMLGIKLAVQNHKDWKTQAGHEERGENAKKDRTNPEPPITKAPDHRNETPKALHWNIKVKILFFQ